MPDSAQTEQELRQRQGVTKEDTLPPVQNVDLQYVPPVPQVLYAPPKLSFWQKLSNSLAPIKHYMLVFLPEILIFGAFLVILVYAMNYFNFLPLSSMYPKVFGVLPHSYDAASNNKALSDIKYSSEIEGYQVEATLYKVSRDRIIIEYKGKTAELLVGPDITCAYETIRKISATEEELLNNSAFCSDVLTKSSQGKKATLRFLRSQSGNNVINSIYLEK
ncbi:MAG: hypothetical protein A3B38_00570 [Candidatus Levybacteria bacterium RIFCSPLOWO2_01_FULL_36_13]|nr:MAG: hypothetical protein A2684_01810 [Candidatus Levybacteria bacterium RIFCSPHIGHO2_01_FULL_36_15b]OGH35381.1 MAG: hypothetical protein A3B38_00570 [Candidatus Levybacteria bacterium RIFCSPLOWO2_01_FULL_36_13]